MNIVEKMQLQGPWTNNPMVQYKISPRLFLYCGLALIILVVSLASLVVVRPGEVAVLVRLGVVQPEVLREGLHLVSPVTRCLRMTVKRQMLEMSSGGGAAEATGGAELVALSADHLPMSIDIGFPFALNPDSAARIYQRIGDDSAIGALIRPAARSAVRDAVARFGWQDASTHRRDQLAILIGVQFRTMIEADLLGLGFSESEAANAFSLLPVQLRRMVPPQIVQDAIADKVRAQQQLEKQETLNQIARLEAERGSSEGVGVTRLFDELPKGYASDQLAVILNALANKTRAEALLQAVQRDRVQTIVMEGGGQLSVPVGQPPR